MYQEINCYEFHHAFETCRPDNFSYKGLGALFNYLEEYEDETGTKIELDVIALCCEYSEFKNLAEFQAAYGDKYESIEDIEQETTVIRIDDEAFIIADF